MEKAKEGTLKRVLPEPYTKYKKLQNRGVVAYFPWDTGANRALRMSTQVRDTIHQPTFHVWIVTAIAVEKEN